MGNQPSSPAPQAPVPPPPPVSPPPLPPPCDSNCQKQKDLALLKTALDSATDRKDEDPVGYEKARIAYYTLLNGQGWLNTEKQRIATQDVQPILAEYNSRYNSLKNQKQSQSMFVTLQNMVKRQEKVDAADNSFFKKQLSQQQDKVDVLNRLHTLQTTQVNYNYIPLFVDFVIFLLVLTIIYLIFSKFSKIQSVFTTTLASQTIP
jgi:hypothetical protein